MYSPSYRQEHLDIDRNIFRLASLHSSTIGSREAIRHDLLFYEGGENQWIRDDLETLKDRGQLPITCNITASIIDSLSGVEIQSRFRAAVRSDSGKDNEEEYTKYVTQILYNIQEHQSIPYKGSLKFRDGLNCGIGWSNIYKENMGYRYEWVNPYNIIPDPDDLSPQYTEMKFVCRKWYLAPDVIKKTWKKATADVDLGSPDLYAGLISPELMDRSSPSGYSFYPSGGNNSRYLVVEVQKKVEERAYSGIDRKGYYFEVFDEDIALKIAESKSSVDEIKATRILRSMILGNTLLELSPLDPDIPNQKEFSYIPWVWGRGFETGIPYGLQKRMHSMARDCNARVTKAVYALNSSRVVFESNEFDDRRKEDIQKELRRLDSVVVLPKDSKYQIISNANLSEQQIGIAESFSSFFMQRMTGITDDSRGIQTNASSGIAQHIRQVNSVKNNVPFFDSFAQMKKREAEHLLSLIQSSYDTNLFSQILSSEGNDFMILNRTIETDDGEEIINDISNVPMSIYIEEVPDYRSSFEERKNNLEIFLGNPGAKDFVFSPTLMKEMGLFRGSAANDVADEMLQSMQQRAMMEQGGNPMAQPTPQNPPSPSQPTAISPYDLTNGGI